MARKEHTHHYIYKTTCSITGKYYIGMHSTSNLDDGYIGSGRRLWLSINKHGKENHSVEILEWLPDRSSLKLREKEIVNEDLLIDKNCMNLVLGGGGGLANDNHRMNFTTAGINNIEFARKNGILVKNRVDRWNSDKSFKENYSMKLSEASKNNKNWVGRKHTSETKTKIGEASSLNQKGDLNSQYGTFWITDGTINRKIKKDQIIPIGWKKGRIIKK